MKMDETTWDRFAHGSGCPLDAPRPSSNEHWEFVAQLSVSSLYLSTNQTYRGHCQLVFDPRHVARLDELSADEWKAMSIDLRRAQIAILRTVNADHVNVESLGNIVPHLHWHIVPRYRDDPRWGLPIWRDSFEAMADTRLSVPEREELVGALRRALEVAAT
jgi:diadenosine tetraphosphate (Ap4A) HIT family hydrolase